MLRVRALAISCLLALAACGQQPASTSSDAPAAAGSSRDATLARIAAGETFRVTLDACEDEGFTGDSDPFGTIKCGETYEIVYTPGVGYSATGLNEGNNTVGTSVGTGTTPEEGGISIWGATFAVQDGDIVSTSDGSAQVGRIAF